LIGITKYVLKSVYFNFEVEKIELGYQITLKLDMCTQFSQLYLPGINYSIAKYHIY